MLGNRIRYYRKKKGYTQKELAQLCGISTSSMSKIESDTKYPTHDQREKIAFALGVPFEIIQFLSISPEKVKADKRDQFERIVKELESMIEV